MVGHFDSLRIFNWFSQIKPCLLQENIYFSGFSQSRGRAEGLFDPPFFQRFGHRQCTVPSRKAGAALTAVRLILCNLDKGFIVAHIPLISGGEVGASTSNRRRRTIGAPRPHSSAAAEGTARSQWPRSETKGTCQRLEGTGGRLGLCPRGSTPVPGL